MFKAGHLYRKKDSGPNAMLCVSVNIRTACFRTHDSFSIKSLDKAELYDDLGFAKGWRNFVYSLLG